MSDQRQRARSLADEALAQGDATGWFDRLYAEAAAGAAIVPWADLTPNPRLVAWLAARRTRWNRALVVGCGYGDDAEHLAAHGASDVVAFDVSTTAIAHAKRRFADSRVTYVVADGFDLPAAWHRAFDLVVEINTLQVLPPERRASLIACLAECVAPDGALLVVARGRDQRDPPGRLPWPLTRAEVELPASHGLVLDTFDDIRDDESPPVRRFVATFVRADRGVWIRRFVPGDREAVVRLHHLALRDVGADAGPGPWDDDLDAIPHVYLERGGEFVVAVADGRVVAMGALLRRADDLGEIKRMRVHPDLQRRGIGRRILLHLERRARELGCRRLVLDTTERQIGARRLYEGTGYAECGRRTQNGFAIVLYEKMLS